MIFNVQAARNLVAGIVVGVALTGSFVLNYVEAYRDDLVNQWIGKRSIIANVDMTRDCPAMACMRAENALVLGSRFEARDGRDGLRLLTARD